MAVDNSRPQSENSAGQDSFSSLAFDFIFFILKVFGENQETVRKFSYN